MGKALIGKKIGMTQYVMEDGTIVPVTICELGPCVVVQKKNEDKDGYDALKIGFLDQKKGRMSKSIEKDFENKNIALKRILREVDLHDSSLDVGSVIDCTIFSENDLVSVSAVSKGKGFAGVVKRYGFGGGKKTHGSHHHRAPGSIGACAYPGEVWKGQKMPGRMGNDKVTVKNLKIMKILADKNIVLISGSVPGTKNTIIKVSEI